uniref:Uncharacterized protein n=1 Tax=Sphaeramia orbicularis TaxID=375764 RepID=A0A672Y426_9TELE
MLKVALVLGCLLSLALATPMERAHKRLARSSSDSNSGEVTFYLNISTLTQNNNWLQQLLALLNLLTTTTTATTTTTTTTAPTTTTTATTTVTTAAP